MAVQTVRPADGGQLITRASAADAGVTHYTAKTNWRRDLSDEIRREGHDYFTPLPTADDALEQAFPSPSSDPITLIHLVRRPNGEAAIVVGTKTTLYRFYADMSGYTEDDPDYCDGYWETPVRWRVIGSGFSANGRRWEFADIDGTTTFSNGIDLPVEYRAEWEAVRPAYELREQGIVCVGTISELNGVLLLADITELTTGGMDTVLNVVKSGSVTIQQAGFRLGAGVSDFSVLTADTSMFNAGDANRLIVWSNGTKERLTTYLSPTQMAVPSGHTVAVSQSFRVTDGFFDSQWEAYALRASGAFFASWMVGELISFPDGSVRKIVEVISSTLAKTDTDYALTAQEGTLNNPLAYVGKEALITAGITTFNEFQYRIIGSELNKPDRFAARTPVIATAGNSLFTLTRTARSLAKYDSVLVDGAGTAGGVLTDATIGALGPGIVRLDKLAITGGTVALMQSASVGSSAFRDDLQDDGSGILRMLPLGGRIIVYKDTNLFIGTYTGIAANPFEFERVNIQQGRGLFYRHTLVSIGDIQHVYAGRDRFYQFNLTTRQPQYLANSDLVGNVFYDYARLADTERIYAADNHPSQEIWVVCPANTATPVLAYDYLYNTFSTVDFAPSAAATVKEAVFPILRETGNWFLLGTTQGVLLFYGLATEPVAAWHVASPQSWQDGKRIYYRRSARPYNATLVGITSTLTGGKMHFGELHGEHELTSYVIQLSSQPQVEGSTQPLYTASLYASLNQLAAEDLVGTVTITNAEDHGLIPVHSIAHFFRDTITVTGTNNPIRIHSRTFDYFYVNSASYHRI